MPFLKFLPLVDIKKHNSTTTKIYVEDKITKFNCILF